MGFFCECRELGCTQMIRLPVEAYRLVRDDPHAFLVVDGHQGAGAYDTVLSRQGQFLIVRADDPPDETAAPTTNGSA